MTNIVRELLVTVEKRINFKQNILPRLKNRRIWHDSGLLILANLIVAGLGLIRTPAMTWVLPKDEVGMLGVVASWLPFLQVLSLPGLDGAAYHYAAKGQIWAYVVNLTHRLRWSILSTIGFLVGAAFWGWRGDTSLAWMFVIAGLSFPITVGLTASAGLLGAQEQFRKLFWYRIGEGLTRFMGFIPLLISVWWISKVFTFYGINQLAFAAMQVGVCIMLLWKLHFTNTTRAPVADAQEMVRYGKHLTAMNGINILQTRTDAILVGTFLPLATMADYSIALLAYGQIKRLWSVYLTIRYPSFVRRARDLRRQRMLREGIVVWLGFAGIGVILALLIHWIVPIVLPSSYINSVKYMNWLIAAFVVSIPGFFAETYLRTEKDEKRLYILRAVAAIPGLILPVLFISSWGVTGVLFGRFLSGIILSISGIILIRR